MDLDRYQVRTVVNKALDFLLTNQNKTGFWEDFETFAGTSTCWVTGYILYKIFPLLEEHHARRSALALMGARNEKGVWGYNETVPADADSTAFAVLGSFPLLNLQIEEKNNIVCFLQSHERTSGYSTYADPELIQNYMGLLGISLSGWKKSHNEVTASVLMALNLLGVKSLESRVKLLMTGEKNGLWNSYWWVSPLVSTALVLECVQSFVKMPEHKMTKSIIMVLSMQNEDGGWSADDGASCPFITSCALDILAHEKKINDQMERGIRWLLAEQMGDGSWKSEPIMRIPPPDCEEPEMIETWIVDGKGGRSLIRDQNRYYTTATILATLHRLESLVR